MKCITTILTLTLFAVVPVAPAAVSDESAALNIHHDTLRRIERRTDRHDWNEKSISHALGELMRLRAWFRDCSKSLTAETAGTRRSLAGDDAAGARDEPAQTAELRRLEQDLARDERILTDCRVLEVRANDLLRRLGDLDQRHLRNRLFARDPPVWVSAAETFANLARHSDQGIARVRAALPNVSTVKFGSVALIAVLLAVVAANAATAARTGRAAARPESGAAHDWIRGLGQFGTALTALLLFAAYRWWVRSDPDTIPLATTMSLGLAVVMALHCGVQVACRNPSAIASPRPRRDRPWRALERLLNRMLALLFVIAIVLHPSVFAAPLSGLLHVIATVLAAVLCIMQAMLTVLVLRLVRRTDLHLLALFSGGALIATFATLVAGYTNLAAYVFHGTVASLLIGFALWLTLAATRSLIDGLDEGGRRWQRRFRRAFGLGRNEFIPGLMWIQTGIATVLCALALLAFLHVWGMTETGSLWLIDRVLKGFSIGDIEVVPFKLFAALFTFSLLLPASKWISNHVDGRGIIQRRLLADEREALVTVAHYLGVVVAVLIALSVAGVRLSHIAIAAGALGVGIGFGLQNIANNFVSGLILLFERPVKTGDWIVSGPIEGYVTKIRARSTEIQTFDQSDVIVPNAYLLENPVTNWTLREPIGRIVVPVGVAYDADTALVSELLLGVATGNEHVIGDGALAPQAIFLEFGESALRFELRCVVRDVRDRFEVSSDLHFGIDAAFRAHGITMPFPQRDVHVHDSSRVSGTPDGRARVTGRFAAHG